MKGTQFFSWLLPLVDVGNFLFRDPSLLRVGEGGSSKMRPTFKELPRFPRLPRDATVATHAGVPW
jgi:hypothetical protein